MEIDELIVLIPKESDSSDSEILRISPVSNQEGISIMDGSSGNTIQEKSRSVTEREKSRNWKDELNVSILISVTINQILTFLSQTY